MAEHTIMVVEDDPHLRESLSDLLVDEGVRVFCAGNGLSALSYLRSGTRPCVILLDLMMPLIDGRTFLEEKAKDPALRDIPVVVHTALSPEETSWLRSAQEVLRKPLDEEVLVEVVRRHCLC
jgi:CheY-like chemotaxis protein